MSYIQFELLCIQQIEQNIHIEYSSNKIKMITAKTTKTSSKRTNPSSEKRMKERWIEQDTEEKKISKRAYVPP